jgi:hypothetical protein
MADKKATKAPEAKQPEVKAADVKKDAPKDAPKDAVAKKEDKKEVRTRGIT